MARANRISGTESTPGDDLVVASMVGNEPEVDKLLAEGADVHTDDDRSLRFAAGRGATGIVKKLLAAGANPHAHDDRALEWAVDKNHKDTVQALLEGGADPQAQGGHFLRLAEQRQYKEIAALLREAIARATQAATVAPERPAPADAAATTQVPSVP